MITHGGQKLPPHIRTLMEASRCTDSCPLALWLCSLSEHRPPLTRFSEHNHLSRFCPGSRPSRLLSPAPPGPTPFSGPFPSVLYSLAFLSLSIVVCDLITSEPLTAAAQGQEAKTVALPVFSPRGRDLRSVCSTQTLQGDGKKGVAVAVLGVTWSCGQLSCVLTSPGPRSRSSLLFSSQATAESHALPSASCAPSALRRAFPMGLGDPEELASASLPCSLGNAGSKTGGEDVLSKLVVLPFPTGHQGEQK